MGAELVIFEADAETDEEEEVEEVVGFSKTTASARFTNENFRRNSPSVLTDKSWRINQIPCSSFKSCNLWAVATKDPIRFLVGGELLLLDPGLPDDDL